MLNSYLGSNFEFIKKADISRYLNGNDIRLLNLGPIAFFSKFKLTTSSGNHLKDLSHALIVSCICFYICFYIVYMYKLLTSSRGDDDMSVGFDRDRNRRRDELTYNKSIKGIYHLRIMLKDVFGFAEYQEKPTYGLGYKLTLTRNKDEAVSDKAEGIVDARIKIDHIHWYVPHYAPSIQQQGILSKQILIETPTELRYIHRSVCMKEVNNQNLWNFELGSEESMNGPIWIVIGSRQRDRQDSQNLDSDTFCRLAITSAQCIIGTEKYPNSSVLFNYDADYS